MSSAALTFAGRTFPIRELAAEVSRHDDPDSAAVITAALLALTARQTYGPQAIVTSSECVEPEGIRSATRYQLTVTDGPHLHHLAVMALREELAATEVALSAYLGT